MGRSFLLAASLQDIENMAKMVVLERPPSKLPVYSKPYSNSQLVLSSTESKSQVPD